MHQYSGSTGGFYRSDVHGATIPPDAVDVSDAEYEALFAGQAGGQLIMPDGLGRPLLADRPPRSAADVRAAVAKEVQARLDAFARSRGYANLVSACSYVGSGVAAWAAEGGRCVELRDATWSAWIAICTAVDDGARDAPECVADVEGDLPALEWSDP